MALYIDSSESENMAKMENIQKLHLAYRFFVRCVKCNKPMVAFSNSESTFYECACGYKLLVQHNKPIGEKENV